MMAPTRVQLYHFVPKYKDNLYINIESKISLYFGTDDGPDSSATLPLCTEM